MSVPLNDGNCFPWDQNQAPYVAEPMNCLTLREYGAVCRPSANGEDDPPD